VAISKTIVFKKLAASVLLALLLIIHGVKFFHHHPTSPLHSYKSYTESFFLAKSGSQLNHHCAICDYQLAKDIDLQIPQFASQAILPENKVYTCDAPSYSFEYSSALHLRGPPVIA
jgi:hypothetical protein